MHCRLSFVPPEVAALCVAFDESVLPCKVELVVRDAALSPEMRVLLARDGVEGPA